MMKRLAWAAGVLLVAALSLELAGRLINLKDRKTFRQIAEKSLFRPDPLLGYALKPDLRIDYAGTTPVETNRFGWRDGEYRREKATGTFRVICIGDSRVFGLGLRAEDTYPKQLERMLRERHSETAIEVINAGVPGYTSREGLVLVREVLPRFHPDLVIASFGHNDRWKSPDRQSEIAAFLGRPPLRRCGLMSAAKKLDDLLDTAPGYFGLKVRLRGLMRFSRLAAPFPESEFKANVPPEDWRDNLTALARAARAEGIPLLFLDFSENPAIFDRAEKGRMHLEQGRLKEAEEELTRAAGIPMNFSPAPHCYLGALYRRMGRNQEAEEQLLIAELGSAVYPHPLRMVREEFRRRGITGRRLSEEALARLSPITNPYGLIEEYQKITAEVSRREEVPAIVLGKGRLREEMFLDADHPSAAGCRFLAEQVAERVLE
jgi:lysophospholipase L1-like esterase